jgi:glyoxylase-like metal-dependent hydrolase (beta-lactamase superfamily II)
MRVHRLPFGRFALLLAAMVVPLGAASQQEQQPRAAGSVSTAEVTPALETELVKTGLYLIKGGGGNSLLRMSASGLVLVNGKLAGSYRPLMSQVRRTTKLSDLPVRALILTDHHETHAGSSAQFAASGVRIIAQQNALANLPELAIASGTASSLPLITYDREYILRIGGVEMQLKHFDNANTNDSAIVYFPDMKIVAVGDLYTPVTPELDVAAGGSLVGWGNALAETLKLDFDLVVPSIGPIVKRADLENFKSKIDALTARASALAKRGVGKDELAAQAGDLDWRFGSNSEQLNRLYVELSRQPQ